jgi:hypothetical protein
VSSFSEHFRDTDYRNGCFSKEVDVCFHGCIYMERNSRRFQSKHAHILEFEVDFDAYKVMTSFMS